MNIETYVKTLEAIAADNSHGYDQTNRTGPDYDCSSLITKGLREAGESSLSWQTTRTLPATLKNLGFKEVAGTPVRGDIYVTPGKHCATATDSSHLVHARSNEYGKATGGKTGDQTGKEICVTSFYTPSYGWTYHFRYGTTSTASNTSTSVNGLKVGQVVTLATAMNVRQGAGTNYKKKAKAELTTDGQKHATSTGSLKKGTKVAIKEIKETSEEIWIRCPSGWICAYQKGVWYVSK